MRTSIAVVLVAIVGIVLYQAFCVSDSAHEGHPNRPSYTPADDRADLSVDSRQSPRDPDRTSPTEDESATEEGGSDRQTGEGLGASARDISQAARDYLQVFLPSGARLTSEQTSQLSQELAPHQNLHAAVLSARAESKANPADARLRKEWREAIRAEQEQFKIAAFHVLTPGQLGHLLNRQPGFIIYSYPLYGGPSVLDVDLTKMTGQSKRSLLRRLRVRSDGAGLSATHVDLMEHIERDLSMTEGR